jgi:hypothetical protein
MTELTNARILDHNLTPQALTIKKNADTTGFKPRGASVST